MKLYQHYSIYGFSNSYLLGNDETLEVIVVDPAEITPTMIAQVENNGYRLAAVLVTHAHVHHVRGLKTLLKIYDAPVHASSSSVTGIPSRQVRDGETIGIAGFDVSVIAVPGHSQDSIVYRVGSILFTGDSLHAGLIGKTLSSFNADALVKRLGDRILAFPDDMLIFPGHGPPSTVGTERRFNVGLRPGYAESQGSRYDFFV